MKTIQSQICLNSHLYIKTTSQLCCLYSVLTVYNSHLSIDSNIVWSIKWQYFSEPWVTFTDRVYTCISQNIMY